ncbi:MAG: PadR family transcriptional regulator [Solirubrobacterales bacterium]|nr:PadR family transcriptional regulator [Solirubrobacterales bacterium]
MDVALSRTEVAVLGLLARFGEQTGYELRKRADRSVAHVWTPTRSQLYAVLPRLAERDLVAGRRIAQSDRPDKQPYAITQAGRAALRAWIRALEPLEPEDRDGLLLKLFFATAADTPAMRAQVADHRERVAARLDEYERLDAALRERPGPATGDHHALRLGLALMRATLAWVEATLTALERDGLPPAPSPPRSTPGR